MNNITPKAAVDLERFNANIRMRVPILISYLLLMLILREVFDVPFPFTVFFLVSFMLLSSLALALYSDRFHSKDTPIIHIYFLYTILDLLILTLVIYYLGGVTWLGFIFYSFYLILNFMTFARAQAIFLTTWIIFLYSLLVTFQYSQLLPSSSLFLPGSQTLFDFPYVLATVVALSATFILVAYYSQGFYQLYSNKISELKITEEILEKERASLEARVGSRKKDLEKERKGLRVKIEDRKKELEKEEKVLRERAEELEKFKKITLGREQKLEELQKELNILQKK